MESKQYWVYMLASDRNGTLYVGVTSELAKRVWQHKNEVTQGFTQKYGVHCLVWFEECGDAIAAITREKQLKRWNRMWKVRAIEVMNPEWRDLYADIC